MTEKELSDKLSFTIERKLSEVSDNIQTLVDDLVDIREGLEGQAERLRSTHWQEARRTYILAIVDTLHEANEAVVTAEDAIRGDISSEDIKKATASK
jgi:hypothetical protein